MNATDRDDTGLPEADLREALADRADRALPDLDRVRDRVEHRGAGPAGFGTRRWRLPLAVAAAVAVIAVATAVLVATRGPNAATPAAGTAAAPDGGGFPTTSDLVGIWRVTGYTVNGHEYHPRADREVTVEFNRPTFSIDAPCEPFAANTWRLYARTLVLDTLITTPVLCTDKDGKVIGTPGFSDLVNALDTEPITIGLTGTGRPGQTTLTLSTTTAQLTAEKTDRQPRVVQTAAVGPATSTRPPGPRKIVISVTTTPSDPPATGRTRDTATG